VNVSLTSWPYAPTFWIGVAPAEPGTPLGTRPRPAALDGSAHDAVPGLAGRGSQLDRTVDLLGADAAHGDLHDQRIDAFVGHDQVGAAAQHVKLGAVLTRPGERPLDRRFVGRVHEPACGPADAEGRQRAERDPLLDRQRRGHGISRVARQGLPV
jgi:hypothetical protein